MNDHAKGYEAALADIDDFIGEYIEQANDWHDVTDAQRIALIKFHHHFQIAHMYERRTQ